MSKWPKSDQFHVSGSWNKSLKRLQGRCQQYLDILLVFWKLLELTVCFHSGPFFKFWNEQWQVNSAEWKIVWIWLAPWSLWMRAGGEQLACTSLYRFSTSSNFSRLAASSVFLIIMHWGTQINTRKSSDANHAIANLSTAKYPGITRVVAFKLRLNLYFHEWVRLKKVILQC